MEDQSRCQCFWIEHLPSIVSFSSHPSPSFQEAHNPHETKREGQCFVSEWPVPFFAHPLKIKHYPKLLLLTIISKFNV